MGNSSDILRRKLSIDFDYLDTDRDGILAREDFERLVHNVHQQFRQSGNQNKFAEFLQSSMRWWDTVVASADEDGDGKVSRDEYVNAHIDLNKSEISAVLDDFVDGLYGYIDSDQDGKISREEFNRLQRARNIPERESVEAFNALDTDGHGYLPKSKFSRFVKDFYTSTDINAQGNQLIGARA